MGNQLLGERGGVLFQNALERLNTYAYLEGCILWKTVLSVADSWHHANVSKLACYLFDSRTGFIFWGDPQACGSQN